MDYVTTNVLAGSLVEELRRNGNYSYVEENGIVDYLHLGHNCW